MVNYDPMKYAYASHRNVLFANKGMCCSASPIASQVGIDIMKRGGNAIDAALAMATTLPLVEPTGNGLGSDFFGLIWTNGKLYGMNGSGVEPMAMNAQIVKDAGFEVVPFDGWLPVMVPGAPSAWAEIHKRFGTLSLEEITAPAIQYAEEGFNIPVNVYKQWKAEAARFTAAAKNNPQVFGPWVEKYTNDGKAPEPGTLFKNPEYAQTMRELAATGFESFYRGDLMKKIVEFSEKTGGYLAASDFENYHAEWVEPISTDYKGYTVSELPPNGHGITVLMALNMLKGMELSGNRDSADTYHKIIETVKLAFVDTKKFVADPRFMKTKVEDMLSDRYAEVRRNLIGHDAVMPEAGNPACGGTVYYCTADTQGNFCSFIQSNYNRFGSGIVIPGTSITLQDRGANFSLDPASDNYLEGGKKAYHTIIPGFLSKDGKPIGPFGVMGGFMQPQGHVQVVVNTIDYHMNPQEALDAPRFQWVGGKKVQLEREVDAHIAYDLQERGHQVEIVNTNLSMGRGQIIWQREDGTLVGGTEPRADGTIAIW